MLPLFGHSLLCGVWASVKWNAPSALQQGDGNRQLPAEAGVSAGLVVEPLKELRLAPFNRGSRLSSKNQSFAMRSREHVA
jgi:hypothetical protein